MNATPDNLFEQLELDLLSCVAEEPDKWACNADAYMALGNVRAGAAQKLIALMRSGEEIHPIIRESIARALQDALDGSDAQSVKLFVDGDGQRTHGAKIATREEYVRIGQYYDAIKSDGVTYSEALESTAKHFNMEHSLKKVESALTYNRKMQQAISHIVDADLRMVAAHQYHLTDIDPDWRSKL